VYFVSELNRSILLRIHDNYFLVKRPFKTAKLITLRLITAVKLNGNHKSLF